MQPTLFPEINLLLESFVSGVKQLLSENVVGTYLFGSLASGDFNEDTSDIDFVVVTKNKLINTEIAELEKLNEQLQQTYPKWASRLEGSFIPVSDFKDIDQISEYPSISTGGIFGMDAKEINAPIQRHMLRENGIALVGPNPKTFIDPVSPEQIKQATQNILKNWWVPQLFDTHRLENREYQAYAVLTMCRMLYTLQTGQIISKPEAAKWAQKQLDKKWFDLIERATNWKVNDEVNDLEQTLEFIRYVSEN